MGTFLKESGKITSSMVKVKKVTDSLILTLLNASIGKKF